MKRILGLVVVWAGFLGVVRGEELRLALGKGEHVCLIGNALAERMQHDGWLETRIQARFPELELSIRNLGFSADELTIRQRVDGFGDENTWLARCKADVVLAFFGFNEAFAGEAGLEKFKQNLAGKIKGLQGQKYNGRSAPKLVFFSPIAYEDLKNPNLPDGKEHNARIKAYAQAMAEVARANGVLYVDLFAPTQALYAAAEEPLTINGIHLKEKGNELLAEVIDEALFGKRAAAFDSKAAAKLREAVLEKNFQWFNRYRPTDDYNIFGGRSSLTYDGVTNYSVLMREMAILEVLTDNRDKKIWAAAQGKDFRIDDSNAPAKIAVKTNKPGQHKDGSYDFLGGEAAIAKMTAAPKMKVNLFASEEQFPELANPVQMEFDAKGRLWVAAWPTYPHWEPQTPMNDKLLIFEDTDGDGKADKCTVFAGDLHDPTGFTFWNGGVLLAQAPDLMFLKDTHGGDKADFRERILHGLSSGDTHHTANSFEIDPGGGLYFSEGVFHQTQIESIFGPVRNQNACIWRFEPRTWRVERYIPYGFANPHGHVIDRWGQDFVHDATGANPYHSTPMSGHVDAGGGHANSAPSLYRQRTRPCPGTEILSSPSFPEEMQGDLLVANVIGLQGILRYKFAEDGSSYQAKEAAELLVSSTDSNFRPSDIRCGPDGAIYFLDWQKPLIGHMQHHIRDPNRDHTHGRIYRITYEGMAPVKPAAVAGESLEKLLELLKNPEDRVRYRARMELSGRKSADVIAAAQKWSQNLDRNDPNYEHHMLEALWLQEAHDFVNMELLQRTLRSSDPHARAAATRVVSNMRDKIKEPLYLLRTQAEDEHGLVRLEAVRACSFFKTAEAAEVALLAMKHPMDQYLTYTLAETMHQLAQYWEPALAKGDSVVKNNPAGAAYILDKVRTADLLKMERNESVYAALLSRHDASDKDRLEALQALGKQNNTSIADETLSAMDRAERSGSPHAAHTVASLARFLCSRPAAELAEQVLRLQNRAEHGKTDEMRAGAYAAWMTAQGSDEGAYAFAARTPEGLNAFLEAVAYVQDAKLRSTLYARVRPLMFALPENLAANQPAVKGSPGLKVAVYQFNPRGATLAAFAGHKPDAAGTTERIAVDLPLVKNRGEVGLIFTGALMIRAAGTYTFSLSSDDGSRMFIDTKEVIDNDGLHGMGGKTAEVKLGLGSHPITITYFNNSGDYGLEALWKGPGFALKPLAPDITGASPGSLVQDAAMRAVTNIPGHDSEKFADFAGLIADPQLRGAAIGGIRALPKAAWSAELAPRVIDTILAFLTSQPASERTSPLSVDALNLGKDMAALLPAEQGQPLLARLQTLNVDVIVIRPVREMMLYDHKRFAVEAGKPVEIVFDNIDQMPHNLVIVKPGALMEVGQAAEQLGQAGAARDSIPDSDKILWHTKLLLPGSNQRLSFTAPTEPGEYPYLCTFPGHYLVMNGIMEVVKDKTLAHAPQLVTIHQETSARKFVKMWETKDLEGDLAAPLQGHNTAHGRELFTAAGCVKCHSIQGTGGKVGPELSEISKKYRGKELLKQIIEPSAIIDDKYRAWVLGTKGGQRLSGLIVKEDEQTVEVMENPLAPNEIEKIKKSEITVRKKSELSPMPTGMLVTLSKEEILELLQYLESGGK